MPWGDYSVGARIVTIQGDSTVENRQINIYTAMTKIYDVIVIGAGHAGCEAALPRLEWAATPWSLTMKLDHIALMPCNPSIGGPAKGHLAREVDALGGEMGRNTDKTFIQIRMLNTGKGRRCSSSGAVGQGDVCAGDA